MGYPNYAYPGYQPYYPQPIPDQLAQLRQQQMQQPMVQGQQVIQQPVQPVPPVNPQNNGIIWVGSKQEADAYLVAPGSAVALWDSNDPVIYLRQADATGKPSTKVYDMVERNDDTAQKKQVPQIDPSQFVKWEDLDAELNEKIEKALAERFRPSSKSGKTKEDKDNG